MAKDFKIAKTEGICTACEKPIPPGETLVALARLSEEELIREDYHPPCWESLQDDPRNDPDVLGTWRTRVPKPEEKKKLLIDDALIINFFERLDGQDDPSRINFRYVLALILMRKRILVYEGMERDDDEREIWNMRMKGSDKYHRVIDPQLDESSIASVSSQLGDIMQGDFE
jgi:hypothetical protein